MGMVFWSSLVSALALIVTVYGLEDGKPFCQKALQCRQEVDKLYQQCRQQQATNANAGNGTNAGCRATIKQKRQQLQEKQNQHRQMVTQCLQGRVNMAIPIPPKRAEKCTGGGNTSGGGGGVGPDVGAELGTAVNAERKKRQSATGQLNATGSTGGGAGRGGGNGRGKGKGGGNGRRGNGNGNGCGKQVRQKHKECERSSRCCSESKYCDLKYELSDLHDQIHQLQLDILEQHRQCQQEKGQEQGAAGKKGSAVSKTGNDLQRDDPIANDEDDDPLEELDDD